MFGPEQPCVRRPFVSTPSRRCTQMLVARLFMRGKLARVICRVPFGACTRLTPLGVGSGLLRGNAAESSEGNELIAACV